ncbi:unnamed protein product, partial [Scytosiphon promiscuus]
CRLRRLVNLNLDRLFAVFWAIDHRLFECRRSKFSTSIVAETISLRGNPKLISRQGAVIVRVMERGDGEAFGKLVDRDRARGNAVGLDGDLRRDQSVLWIVEGGLCVVDRQPHQRVAGDCTDHANHDSIGRFLATLERCFTAGQIQGRRLIIIRRNDAGCIGKGRRAKLV